jgi:hypothetical protein
MYKYSAVYLGGPNDWAVKCDFAGNPGIGVDPIHKNMMLVRSEREASALAVMLTVMNAVPIERGMR